MNKGLFLIRWLVGILLLWAAWNTAPQVKIAAFVWVLSALFFIPPSAKLIHTKILSFGPEWLKLLLGVFLATLGTQFLPPPEPVQTPVVVALPTPTPMPVAETKEIDFAAQAKQRAQQDFNDFMDQSEQVAFTTGYDASKKPFTMYAGSAWYAQPADFKKNFMKEIASLQDEISGESHLVVIDKDSNQKLAEILSASASAKIYK